MKTTNATPFTDPHLEQQLAQFKPLPQAQPRGQGRLAHQVSGREQTEFVPTAAINSQAGVREGVSARLFALGQRVGNVVRLAGQRYTPMRRSRGGKAERKEEYEEESAFLAPVRDALDLLSEDSGRERQEELEAQLARYFQPVQRYYVLLEALQQLENEDMPSRNKNAVRRALNGMMSALVKKHPHELRKALQETEDMAAAVDVMSEDLPSSVRLRFLIGAKDTGKVDTPLTPLTMLKALIKYFGAERCVLALSSLRSRLMAGF